jgi:hypothetical protein
MCLPACSDDTGVSFVLVDDVVAPGDFVKFDITSDDEDVATGFETFLARQDGDGWTRTVVSR